ncbi:MAG: cell division protein SepF [Naasia sp.]|jgi:cell division inhibitor SepF|uniref:cell division protein SepF n=1 Tax=Naasia sp. TaxID=2546198 RepID=UPI00262CD2D6|nr:cell division protein SepF [Naasia sp.]MCU1569275.1 cell division protein SepF [Naasia sp.]
MSNPIRNAMVYLGLADEPDEYDSPDAPAAPVQHVASAAPAPGRATVTPLPRRSSLREQRAAPSEMNEILTVHPRQYKDAQMIAESFRDGVPVIINLSQMSETDARRLIDFASGLSQGLYGKIERVTNKVFLLSPAHVAVSGDTTTADETDESYGS